MRWKHLRFGTVEQKREVARRLGPFLALILGLVLSACSDTPTSAEGARRTTGIGGLTVYACQYGGFYPDCNLPPDAPIVVNPNPANQETQQQCNLLLGPCGGGGDGGTGDVPPDTTACPHTAPECKQPLRSADSTTLHRASTRWKTAYSDTTAARICEQAKTRYLQAWNEQKVFRGNPGIADAADDQHDAQSAREAGEIHIDSDILDRASDPAAPYYEYYQRALARILLHEAAHLLRYSHGRGETWENYTSFPFNYTTGGPGAAEQCT